jgi:hypothetical protein
VAVVEALVRTVDAEIKTMPSGRIEGDAARSADRIVTPMHVMIVRHARAGNTRQWSGPDRFDRSTTQVNFTPSD